MKTIIYILLVFHLSFSSFAQFAVRGKVVTADAKVVPFSSVLLLKQKDSTLVKGTLSGEEGTYLFENISSGNYMILATYVGFQKTYLHPFYLVGDFAADNLVLLEGSDLKEVVVRKSKPL